MTEVACTASVSWHTPPLLRREGVREVGAVDPPHEGLPTAVSRPINLEPLIRGGLNPALSDFLPLRDKATRHRTYIPTYIRTYIRTYIPRPMSGPPPTVTINKPRDTRKYVGIIVTLPSTTHY